MSLPLWLEFALSASNQPDRSDVQHAFRLLHDEIKSQLSLNDWKGLSQLLDQLCSHAGKLSPVLAVSGLRLTRLVRSSIPNWNRCKNEIATALREKGYDADQIMAGLGLGSMRRDQPTLPVPPHRGQGGVSTSAPTSPANAHALAPTATGPAFGGVSGSAHGQAQPF